MTSIFHQKGIGRILQDLLSSAVSKLLNLKPKRRLDITPTGGEEYDAWNFQSLLQGDWNPDAARIRIDRISRTLAIAWSLFLGWIILAQGFDKDKTLFWVIPIAADFKLQSGEFIAVVTTTTASVFGFLIIVARHLFSGSDSKDKKNDSELPSNPDQQA